jgi:hypothetical protein
MYSVTSPNVFPLYLHYICFAILSNPVPHTHGKEKHTVFYGENLKEKKSLGKPRRWWETNIKIRVRLCTG